MEKLIRQFIRELGIDSQDANTPNRVEKAYRFLTSGYGKNPAEVIKNSVYNEKNKGLIVIKDIEFVSLCEHHLLPFFGKCHIGYIPDGKLLGFSKLHRLVDLYSKRLQIQERITSQVAGAIQDIIKPKGIAVVMEATHICTMLEGYNINSSKSITSCMLGSLSQGTKNSNDFWNIINAPAAEDIKDKIILKDLEFVANVGATGKERKAKQTLFIDLELYLSLKDAGRKDRLEITTDYGNAISIVRNILKGRRFILLESIAESIANELLNNLKIRKARVRVKKTNKKIVKKALYYAVEIERNMEGDTNEEIYQRD